MSLRPTFSLTPPRSRATWLLLSVVTPVTSAYFKVVALTALSSAVALTLKAVSYTHL